MTSIGEDMAQNPTTHRVIEREFAVVGDLTLGVSQVIAKGGFKEGEPRAKAGLYTPTRRLGGWALPVGVVDAGGATRVLPDRDGQDVEVADRLGRVDWSRYIAKGMWNDGHLAPLPSGAWPPHAADRLAAGNHNPVYVGVAEGLVYAAPGSELAKAHGKWGFYTWGHLFDPDDPASWAGYTDHKPTDEDLERAAYYWGIAQALDDTDARLGFSIHGTADFSACRKRVLGVSIAEMAVVTGPRMPGATADILKGQAIELQMGRAQVTDIVCGRCSCPPGSCVAVLKGMTAADIAPALPQDLEGYTRDTAREAVAFAVAESRGCDITAAYQLVDDLPEASALFSLLPERDHAAT